MESVSVQKTYNLFFSGFDVSSCLLLPLQFLSSMKKFQQFLSSHIYVFNTHPSSEDVIQLALNKEENEDIYKQAVVAARKHDQQKFWLIWK